MDYIVNFTLQIQFYGLLCNHNQNLVITIMVKEKIKNDMNILIEIIYKNYLRDSRSGKISNEFIKSYGKIINKRNVFNNHDNPTLFNYGK